MLGADRNLWVVKFQNNPQHIRVLANEMIATRLAAAIGLSVPETEVMEVTPWIVEHSEGMHFELGLGQRERCRPGLHLGSKFVGGLMPGRSVDFLPDQQLEEVRNLAEFAGILCLDKWGGNCDSRQAVFSRRSRQSRYHATFIDQGFFFSAGEWSFSDAPLRGIYDRNAVYAKVTGWDSFDPWLSCIEEMQPSILWRIAETVPPEWYGGNLYDLECLVEKMLTRRSLVRDLIVSFRDSDREPFPHWVRTSPVSVPQQFSC